MSKKKTSLLVLAGFVAGWGTAYGVAEVLYRWDENLAKRSKPDGKRSDVIMPGTPEWQDELSRLADEAKQFRMPRTDEVRKQPFPVFKARDEDVHEEGEPCTFNGWDRCNLCGATRPD